LGERDHRFRLDGTIVLHDGLMYVSLVLLVGHLYLAVIHPSTRHALRGMTTGSVDRHWALRHHEKWVRTPGRGDGEADDRDGDPRGSGRQNRPGADRAREPEPRRARRDAARDERTRALPVDPLARGPRRDPADRTRRGGRPDRRARARRRRLRHEAVLAARAGRARENRAAPLDAHPRSAGTDRARRARARCRHTRGAARRRAPAPDGEGVRPALLPRLERPARLFPRPADEPRLGLRGRARHRHRHRSRPPPAREDRARSLEAAAPRDRLGRRLPVRGVIGLGIAVAAATLAAALGATLGLRLLPTVRLQLAGLALLAVVIPLAAVLMSGWVMFHMGDDLKVLEVAAGAATAAVAAGLA